nr:MAG TPA: hypothetical protein [Caudoviricetes sp.]
MKTSVSLRLTIILTKNIYKASYFRVFDRCFTSGAAHFRLTIFIYREPAVCPIFRTWRAIGSQSRHFCPYIGLKSFFVFQKIFS